MDQRVQFIADYQRGLFGIAKLARQYGISRKTADKWIDRYDAHGRQRTVTDTRTGTVTTFDYDNADRVTFVATVMSSTGTAHGGLCRYTPGAFRAAGRVARLDWCVRRPPRGGGCRSEARNVGQDYGHQHLRHPGW